MLMLQTGTHSIDSNHDDYEEPPKACVFSYVRYLQLVKDVVVRMFDAISFLGQGCATVAV
jgi:hypothetical protein